MKRTFAFAVLLTAVTVVTPQAPVQAAVSFKHPGVQVSANRLERARKNLKKEPWKSALAALKKDPLVKLTRKPTPYAVVECGPYTKPDIGCTAEINDSLAAYGQALLWQLTRNPKNKAKALAYLDAWSGRLTAHTNSNARLQAGWAGINWAKAGELMRHSVTHKPWKHEARFAKMLRTVHLPAVIDGMPGETNGNWDLVMADAAIGISVFLDDRPSFTRAVALWRARVPAHFYLKTDGPTPNQPPGGVPDIVKFWQGQTTFVDGLTQETCRDLNHTSWGLSAALQTAETARLQGVHLYAEQARRLTKALEFNTKYALAKLANKPIPGWLCKGRLNRSMKPVLEVGYSAYGKSHPLPYTRKLMLRQRPAGRSIFQAWETLTHA